MESFAVDPKKLEEMLTDCLDFAKKMLGAHGEFHPFGAQVDISGKVGSVGAWNGEEHPEGKELAKVLIDSFRQSFAQKEICAAAICVNVNMPPQFNAPFPDGIRVTIECDGYARNIYLPYRLGSRGFWSKIRGKSMPVEYAELIPVEIKPYLTGAS